MKIFVQIASYRDPQLVPTIKNMLENAEYPENLRFSIARQYHTDDKFDDLSEYDNDNRFKIINIPYNESKGVCWARNLTQQQYDGEEYTLQLDSHMRFEKKWDTTLIEMLKQLQENGYEKPLLTSYVPSFDPDNDPESRKHEPWRMVFDRFIPEGAVFFLPEVIPNWESLTQPIPSRFYSAHFCFTIGRFSIDVQHDPDFYFHGEEISIAARAYTHGYDLFHPHKVVVWHEYTRKGRTKQWNDDKTWGQKNMLSHKKNRKLFSMDGEAYDKKEFGKYGFGDVRTLNDYEKYSGIKFNNRSVQQYTLDKKYPPNPYEFKTQLEWEKSFIKKHKIGITLSKKLFNEQDYDFWVVAFHDEKNNTIFRQDANINEISTYLNSPNDNITIWREFYNEITPKYWVVWPHSKTNGWGEKLFNDI